MWKWIQSFLIGRKQRVCVNGSFSDWEDVALGVPQGTILGPTLFLIYINDIVMGLKSCAKLYADDCVIYRVIESEDDNAILQQDLNTLCDWSAKWQLKFNTDKCKIMHISHSRNNIFKEYFMYGKPLSTTNEKKYLGVTITNKLSWSSHINNIVCESYRKLGIISRVFYYSSQYVKNKLYCQIVRSKLKFCNTVWDPYHLYLQRKIERVQKRAGQIVLSAWGIPYCNILKELRWLSLHQRRFFFI